LNQTSRQRVFDGFFRNVSWVSRWKERNLWYKLEIRESIFDLPVHQPDKRSEWHCYEFLDPAGHPVNRAGLVTDDRFRPLDRSGNAAHDRLFAAGSILAYQDWMRQKCGSGLAIATAYAAVNAFLDYNAS